MESAEIVVAVSLGMCKKCEHNVYADKSHPSWMACYCEKPEFDAIIPTPAPVDYGDYC